jgi:hypothetical protein
MLLPLDFQDGIYGAGGKLAIIIYKYGALKKQQLELFKFRAHLS